MSQLLDEILSSENMKLAYKNVKANKLAEYSLGIAMVVGIALAIIIAG